MRLDVGRAYFAIGWSKGPTGAGLPSFAIGGASPTVGQTRREIAEPT